MAAGGAVRPLGDADLPWAEALLARELGGRRQARLGQLVDALEGSGLIAEDEAGRPVGAVTWVIDGSESGAGAEIRVLVVEPAARRRGVGGKLLDEAERSVGAAGVDRAWLVTTNDNLTALAFYQRRGWRLAELHPGGVDEARRGLKPEIGRLGESGIPIRDELVLVKELP